MPKKSKTNIPPMNLTKTIFSHGKDYFTLRQSFRNQGVMYKMVFQYSNS
jgi:hypothetical protein